MRKDIFAALLSLVLFSTAALADVPGLISYQGTLTDDSGVALDTTVSMTFTIYTDSTGPSFLWTETQPSVVVNHGLFNVLLGRVNPIPGTVFDWLTCWLSVRVGSDPALQPRQRIVSTGYSFRAAEADTADYARSATAASDGDWTIVGDDMYSAVPGNVGIGMTNPLSKLTVREESANELQYPLRLTNPDNTDTGGTATGVLFETEGNNYGKGGLVYERRDSFARGDFHFLQNTIADHSTPALSDAVVTMKNNGNVGIATMSPDYALDVNGNAGFNDYIYHNLDGDTYLYLSTDQMDLYAGNVRMLTVDETTQDVVVMNENSADIDFRVESDNETHALFVRGSDGNVGIGTANPSYNLHVYDGSSGNFGYMASGSYGAYGKHAGSGDYGYLGGSGIGVFGSSSSGYGVYGSSNTYGVFGINSGNSNYGYVGTSSYGVRGYATLGTAVYGSHSGGNNGFLGGSSYGVYGYHNGGNYGVLGTGSDGAAGLSTDGYGVYGQSSTGHGAAGFSSGGYGVYGSSTDSVGVYGYSTNDYGVQGEHSAGNYGFLASGAYGVYGHYNNTNYGYLGSISYGMRGSSYETSTGTAGAYGHHGTSTAGTGYRYDATMCGVVGRSVYGTNYHCGGQGATYWGDTGNRTSGVHGRCADQDGYWGSLSYKTSGNALYGGYFTSYTTGSGKGSLGSEAQTAIGLGSWGDLFGADIHGKTYGTYTEGGNYALYSNGDVFTHGMDVHLQDTETPSMAVLYTNVSIDVTVQTSGFSRLSKGACRIEFDDDFKKVVSPDVPVVVTVTPTGDCNGVHVSGVTKDGFTVVENNAGKSSVTVAFIAIGRRAGYENPRLPAEVISSDYVKKLSRGLHNDADTETDGEGLYFEDGQLYVGVHPSTLPDPNRRRRESEEIKEKRRELSETQEQERLERRLVEEKTRRLEEEARRIEEEQRTRLEVEEEQKHVNVKNTEGPKRRETESR
jgi:hypothetical protein